MQREINKINITMTKLETNIDYIKASLDCNKKEHKELRETIDKFIETSEKKFAPKWVEKVIVWGGIVTGGVVITSLMNLIIK